MVVVMIYSCKEVLDLQTIKFVISIEIIARTVCFCYGLSNSMMNPRQSIGTVVNHLLHHIRSPTGIIANLSGIGYLSVGHIFKVSNQIKVSIQFWYILKELFLPIETNGGGDNSGHGWKNIGEIIMVKFDAMIDHERICFMLEETFHHFIPIT